VVYSSTVLHAGGNTCVPGLDAALAERLREDAITSFATSVVVGAWCCGHICWRKWKAGVAPARTTSAYITAGKLLYNSIQSAILRDLIGQFSQLN
jgi:hypothetical protein